MFVFRLRPPLPTLDILCYVLYCAYAYAKVCVGGGGTYAYACIKCVDFYACVYVCCPPPSPTLVSLTCETCVNVFVVVLF